MNEILLFYGCWIVCLSFRLWLGRKFEPRLYGLFLVYLGLTIVVALGIGAMAFAPYEHRDAFPPYGHRFASFFGPCVIAWIPVSTLVMFTVPLRLILFPNAYVLGLIVLYVMLWGCLDSGNEESIPNIEMLVFAIILVSGSIAGFIQLKNHRSADGITKPNET